MKSWRHANRQNKVIARRATLESKLGDRDQEQTTNTRPPPAIETYHHPKRPGTVLRHEIKKFQKGTTERLKHTKYSSDGTHKSSIDKREARRIGKLALEHVELFHGLPIARLAERLRFTSFRIGDHVIEENVVGRLLYVVLEGQVAIYVGPNKLLVATKDVGTILGERSMIFDQLTTATCIAITPVRCAFLTRNAFNESLPEGGLSMLIEHCRKQDTLSQGGARSYSHLDENMQNGVYTRIKNLAKRLIRDLNSRRVNRKKRAAEVKRYWEKLMLLQKNNFISTPFVH